MERICIAADSTFDMTLDMVRQYNIEVCPSYVRMGDTDYLDYPDLKQSDLFDYFRSAKKLPQTAAANPNDYETFFKKCLEIYLISVHNYIRQRIKYCQRGVGQNRLRGDVLPFRPV